MGLLDTFRRTKTTLALEADPVDPVPGGELRLHVSIGGELDEKVQGGKVGIRCVNSYLVRERDNDGDTHEVWRSAILLEETQELPAALGSDTFAFTLPPDAPPRSDHAVAWTAFARLDRRRGIDVQEELDLTVRLPADRLASEREPPEPADGLSFAELPARVRAGQTLSGVLEVALDEDVSATGVTITLSQARTYTSRAWEGADADRVASIEAGDVEISLREGGLSIGSSTSTITKRDEVVEVQLGERRDFVAGQVERLPFELPVPADAGPTVAAPHAVVEWQIRATLRRRLRDDLEVAAPVGVFDAG